MGFLDIFNLKTDLSPTKAERERLSATSVRFAQSDLQGRLESQAGQYVGSPLPSDEKAARDLMKTLRPRTTVRLIGELKPCNDGVGLFFRGRKVDTLTSASAKSALDKIGASAPVIFELTYVKSNDGERTWPSIKIKQGRSI
jgi:hypothetical protein